MQAFKNAERFAKLTDTHDNVKNKLFPKLTLNCNIKRNYYGNERRELVSASVPENSSLKISCSTKFFSLMAARFTVCSLNCFVVSKHEQPVSRNQA